MKNLTIYTIFLFSAIEITVSCGTRNFKHQSVASALSKTEVQVLSLSTYSEDEKKYKLTLGSTLDTTLQMSMLIGYYEAQELAVTLEKIKPKFPLPLDILHDAINKFGYSVDQVQIDNLVDSVYKATITCSGKTEKVLLAARPVDAITIALKFNRPIFIKTDFLMR